MKGTDTEGYAVVVGDDTGVKGVGFINSGWKRNTWEGNIGVMMEAEHYPTDCIERVPEESRGHGATGPIPSVGRAVGSEGRGKVVAFGGAGGEGDGE